MTPMVTKRNVAVVVSVLLLGMMIGSCAPTTPGGAAPPNGIVYDAKFVTNPARVEMPGTGTWVDLPGASTTISATTTPATLVARFWANSACTGGGVESERYVRIVIDGTHAATGPLQISPKGVGSGSFQFEETSTVQASRSVGTGTHNVQIQVKIGLAAACVITADLWHLDVEMFAV
jgi:hypothetical protein